MTAESATQGPEGSTATSPDAPTVNIQIVSPSVGVTRPLLFSALPISTTVKELKERIRQTLPLRPADENQRLIYHGRAIIRETETLEDVLGPAAVNALPRHEDVLFRSNMCTCRSRTKSSKPFTSSLESRVKARSPPLRQRYLEHAASPQQVLCLTRIE